MPGTVAVYVPLFLFPHAAPDSLVRWVIAAMLWLAGGSIYLWCLWDFATFGRGTPAPIDPPRELVVRGLYRYSRNPMYIGVILILLGEALFFQSGRLLLYAGLFFGAANIFVVGYEEQRLRTKFGKAYEYYCRDVGRWVPGRPYRPDP